MVASRVWRSAASERALLLSGCELLPGTPGRDVRVFCYVYFSLAPVEERLRRGVLFHADLGQEARGAFGRRPCHSHHSMARASHPLCKCVLTQTC